MKPLAKQHRSRSPQAKDAPRPKTDRESSDEEEPSFGPAIPKNLAEKQQKTAIQQQPSKNDSEKPQENPVFKRRGQAQTKKNKIEAKRTEIRDRILDRARHEERIVQEFKNALLEKKRKQQL